MPLARTKTTDDLSRTCHNGNHDGCKHIIGRGGRLWPGPEPRAHLILCSCRCHADCPTQPDAVGEDEALYLSCTCFDHTVTLEGHRQARAESQRTGEVLPAAIRNIRSDMDRTQVRRSLEEQITAEGVTIPAPVLDYYADMIIANRRHDGGLSALGVTLRNCGYITKAMWRASRKSC